MYPGHTTRAMFHYCNIFLSVEILSMPRCTDRQALLKLNAQDILQETFINVYRHIGKFEEKSKLYTWLYRIATNESIRLLNNKKIDLSASEDISGKLINTLKENATESADSILIKFQEAVLLLPEKQRLVFNLRYYDELSYEEISGILNSSVNALKTNYHLASEKVKKYMLNQQL